MLILLSVLVLSGAVAVGALLSERLAIRGTPTTGTTPQSPRLEVIATPSQHLEVVPPPLTLLHDLCAVAGMSDAQLCRLWRTSYVYLQRNRSAAALTRVSGLRGIVLDELATRDPGGFARWMASGARAASDPARFIGRPSAP